MRERKKSEREREKEKKKREIKKERRKGGIDSSYFSVYVSVFGGGFVRRDFGLNAPPAGSVVCDFKQRPLEATDLREAEYFRTAFNSHHHLPVYVSVLAMQRESDSGCLLEGSKHCECCTKVLGNMSMPRNVLVRLQLTSTNNCIMSKGNQLPFYRFFKNILYLFLH